MRASSSLRLVRPMSLSTPIRNYACIAVGRDADFGVRPIGPVLSDSFGIRSRVPFALPDPGMHARSFAVGVAARTSSTHPLAVQRDDRQSDGSTLQRDSESAVVAVISVLILACAQLGFPFAQGCSSSFFVAAQVGFDFSCHHDAGSCHEAPFLCDLAGEDGH